jgi:hypothetical protein
MIHYNIHRIRVIKKNGHFELLKTLNCNIVVTDLKAYREQLILEYECTNVHFDYTAVDG